MAIRVSSVLRIVTGLFAVINIICGVPIALGVISARTLVPEIMANFDGSCDGDDNNSNAPERLYNIVFGLLAVMLGLVRVFAVRFWWEMPQIRWLAVTSYGIEFARDAMMMKEGFIGPSEAVALVPSFLLGLAMLVCQWFNQIEKTESLKMS